MKIKNPIRLYEYEDGEILYLRLKEAPWGHSSFYGSVTLDFDEENNLIGIELSGEAVQAIHKNDKQLY